LPLQVNNGGELLSLISALAHLQGEGESLIVEQMTWVIVLQQRLGVECLRVDHGLSGLCDSVV